MQTEDVSMSRRVLLLSVLFAAVVAVATSSPSAVDAAPLPAGSKSYTQVQYNADFLEYLEKQFGDYRATTEDPAELRPTAAAYLATALRALSGHVVKHTEAERYREGRSLLEKGVRDRRVMLAVVPVARTAGDLKLAEQWINEIVATPVGPAYPPFAAFLARLEQLRVAEAVQTYFAGQRTIAEQAAKDLQTWMVDAKPQGRELRFVWSLLWPLSDGRVLIQLRQPFYDVPAKDERLDEGFRKLIAGAYLRHLAWDHRGDRFAGSTSKQQFDNFHTYLAQSVEQLEAAARLMPEAPEPPTILIACAMAGGGETPARDWFDQAVARQFDYIPAYGNYEHALDPRWGGSYAAMYQFGLECLATQRFDTNVPCVLARTLEGYDETKQLIREPQVYKALSAMFAGLYEHRNWDELDAWRGNERATRAWHAVAAVSVERYDDARKQYEWLGDDVPTTPGEIFGQYTRLIRNRTYALTGPAADKVAPARKVLNDESLDPAAKQAKAKPLLDEIMTLDPHPRTQEYCTDLLHQLQLEVDFDSGKLLEIKFTPRLDGFWPRAGRWRAEDERTLIGVADGSSMDIDIASMFRLQQPYEFSCTIETAEDSLPFFFPLARLGYYPKAGDRDIYGAQFFVGSVGPAVGMDRETPFDRSDRVHQAYPYRPSSRLHCQVWPEYIRMMVDGDVIVDRAAPGYSPYGPIGFGTTLATSRGTMRIRDARLQRLVQMQPPPDNPAARLRYFDEWIAKRPDDACARADRGAVRFDLKQADGALDDFRAAAKLSPDTPRYAILSARSSYFAGKQAEAKQTAEEFLQRHPHSPDVHLYLTDLLSIADEAGVADLNAALQHAEAGAKLGRSLRWNEYLVWCSALSRTGDLKAALKQLTMAPARAPEAVKPMLFQTFASLQKGRPYIPKEHQGYPLDFLKTTAK
jgi:hypothetical protein